MSFDKNLSAIFDRIANSEETEGDMQTLRRLLRAGDGKNVLQIGKNIVNIAEGRDIQIGDRTYYGNDAEVIKEALRAVLEEKRKAHRADENEQRLLTKVKQEVEKFLEDTLFNIEPINLRKQLQPEQVKPRRNISVKIGEKPALMLSETTDILEVFDRKEIAGKLLILGDPGSGKTTTLVELAQALIARAEQQSNYPIPVLFELSSWKDDKQSMRDWLVAKLKLNYGVPKDIGAKWVDDAKLLPMLDGLDELESQRQEPCVRAINELLIGENSPIYLVVCSRTEEYENLVKACKTRLQLNGAICLQPLTNNQIREYLSSVNHANLCQTIDNDPNLLELVKTPFLLRVVNLTYEEISMAMEDRQQLELAVFNCLYNFLTAYVQNLLKLTTQPSLFNVFILAYQNIFIKSFEELQQFISIKIRLQYLLDNYVEKMLRQNMNNLYYTENTLPDDEQTKQWLIYLAQQLERESQTEFLIEKMQPYWLESSSLKLYYWLVNLPVILFISLSMNKNFLLSKEILGLRDWSDWQVNVAGAVLTFGLASKLFVYLTPEIETVERLRWTPKADFFVGKLALMLILGVPFWWQFASSNGLSVRQAVAGLLFGIGAVGMWSGSLIETLFNMLGSLEIETKTVANQGIWDSAANARIIGLFGGALGGVIGWVCGGLFGALFGSLSWGLIGSLRFGGAACIQHFALRLTLFLSGYIPWNYARFLDYCTERLFLQRVGGRYRFIHRLLQEHFAAMPLEGVGNRKTN